MIIRFARSLMLLGVCLPAVAAEDKPEQIAKRKADEVVQATIKGDWAKLADLTHPKAVELVGGRKKMIDKMDAGRKEMKAKGFDFSSGKVEDAAPLAPGGSEVFTVIPLMLEMKVPEGRATIKSFLIGVSSDKGKTWSFVDGSGVGGNEKMMKQILPNLPTKLNLPKKEKPVFHKE